MYVNTSIISVKLCIYSISLKIQQYDWSRNPIYLRNMIISYERNEITLIKYANTHAFLTYSNILVMKG